MALLTARGGGGGGPPSNATISVSITSPSTAGSTTSTGSGSASSTRSGTGTGTGTPGDPAATPIGTTTQGVPGSMAVPAAPSITTQPRSVVLAGGDAATFTVVADGIGATSYQWSRAGTPIVGPTAASYTIASVQLSDSGATFAVSVANASGTTSSAAARLSVNAALSQGASNGSTSA